MPRKWLSIRQADLDRQLQAIDPSRVSDVDARAMILEHERYQKRNTTAAILTRLRAAFNERRQQVARSRVLQAHDKPDAEHPSSAQWEVFLSSDDFVAFICHSLRLPLVDRHADLALARWRLKMATRDANGISLASMFRDCIASAIDEWQQRQRHRRKPDEMAEQAIELLQDVEREIVQADGAAVDSLAG